MVVAVHYIADRGGGDLLDFLDIDLGGRGIHGVRCDDAVSGHHKHGLRALVAEDVHVVCQLSGLILRRLSSKDAKCDSTEKDKGSNSEQRTHMFLHNVPSLFFQSSEASLYIAALSLSNTPPT